MTVTAVAVLAVLREHTTMTCTAICAFLGIKRSKRVWWAKKRVTYSNRAYAKYRQVGRSLQTLKRDGAVRYRRGRGAGWEITELGLMRIMEYRRLPKNGGSQ